MAISVRIEYENIFDRITSRKNTRQVISTTRLTGITGGVIHYYLIKKYIFLYSIN